MIRKLLATTAIATLVATGAMAQTTTPAPAPATGTDAAAPAAPMVKKAEGELASQIIGENVYSGTGDDAENIGEVNDIVVGPDGMIQALVVGVGGFLGIGEKNVALEYKLAEWVDRDNDRWIVIPTTADALKALEDFDSAAYSPQPADADVTEVKPATQEDLQNAEQQANAQNAADDAEQPAADGAAPATGAAPMASTDTTAAAPTGTDAGNDPAAPVTNDTAAAETPASGETTAAIDRESLTEVPAADLTAENLEGTTVYGANDENVGEIEDIALTTDGKVDAVILDVGGFLGMGEKQVAVGMDNLKFMADEDGNRYLYTQFTKEQLEAQPEYNKDGWAENRDTMRMMAN